MMGSDFMEEIEVVRNSELKAGYSTLGIVREKAFESIHRYVISMGSSSRGVCA